MPPALFRNERVLVAIPAFDEAASLGAVIAELRSVLPRCDLLVVDDGSTDGTAAIAAGLGVLTCRLPFNIGVGGAMRAAYVYAQRAGYDVVVQLDADGQHDPRYIETMVEALADADVVIGARFAGVGDYRVGFLRRAAMRLLSRVLSQLSDAQLDDVTSGFRAAGKRAIDLYAVHYPAEYLGDTVESLVIAVRTGCKITQVPVEMRPRSAGEPSQSASRAFGYLLRAFSALALAMVRQWSVPDLPTRPVVEVSAVQP